MGNRPLKGEEKQAREVRDILVLPACQVMLKLLLPPIIAIGGNRTTGGALEFLMAKCLLLVDEELQ